MKGLILLLVGGAVLAADFSVKFSEHSRKRVAGRVDGAVPIQFDSSCTLDACIVNLTLGRDTVTSIRDLKTNEVHIRSAGHVMTAAESEALATLSQGIALKPGGTPAEENLDRYVNMLSEAPVGMKLEDFDMKPPHSAEK